MSTVVEVIPLEGIDLDSAPPCEFWKGYQAQCGDPSVVRVHVKCSCGRETNVFLCGPCNELLKEGVAQCLTCLSTDISWGES